MADYQPLIAKAVAGLDKNTGEARRVLYERARKALVGQLRNMTPPLTELEITRERLALEEAIRKVEADAARRMRTDPLPEEGAAAPAEAADAAEVREETAPAEVATAEADAGATATPSSPAEKDKEPPPPAPSGPGRFFRRAKPAPRSNLSNEGLKGFRDVVAEADALGEKTAQGAKAAREAYASMPAHAPELDRVEPRVEPDGLRGSAPGRDRGVSRVPEPPGRASGLPPPPPQRADVRPTGKPPRRAAPAKAKTPARSRKGLIAALLSLIVIFALAASAVWHRERIASFFGQVRGLSPITRDAQPQKPKITDRVGQDSQQQAQQRPAQPPATSTAPAGQAAVAQRVVLYEEDPAEPSGKRYVGSAIWRTETVSPGPGLASELAIRCDVEIPERRLAMTLSIRRNTDAALPASHTIEIMFNLPADFPFGGINNVPGILMKQAEQTRGAPLSGLAVKVTSGFFLVGLSAVETEMQRNIELLKERAWFDIPVVYNNGRRAILAIEKGNPGDRVFAEAFGAWKQ